MQYTDNFGINKPELNNTADIRVLTQGFDTIDKGLTLDVGDSTGSGNDYVLNIGSITLTSTSKGISFKFWADKDSTGAVTINGNYNLIKAGGGAVTNIRKDAPYIITFDGNSNFFLASGGGADTVSFTSDKLLENYTANDSDGNAVSGTMPERGNVTQVLTLNGTINLPEGHYSSIKVTQNVTTRGAYTDAVSQYADSSGLYTRIPTGAYFTKQEKSGYPEIKSKISEISNALKNLPSDKKNEVLDNMGGKQCVIGTYTPTERREFIRLNGKYPDSYYVVKVDNISFTPKYIFCYETANISSFTFLYNNIFKVSRFTNYANGSQEHYSLSDNSFAISNNRVYIPVASSKSWTYVIIG